MFKKGSIFVLKREDRLRLEGKNKQACFVLRSACAIFAVPNRYYYKFK